MNSGVARYSFGMPELIDGIGIGTIAMGMFGFSRDHPQPRAGRGSARCSPRASRACCPTGRTSSSRDAGDLRGTALGSLLGILPGGGPVLGSFSAYTLEKKLAKDPSRFGKGAIEGVAAPESANNAAAQTSFIPLLTLGIPSNPVMALMIGAMIIHGIQPGPQIMTAKPELFWGMIASHVGRQLHAGGAEPAADRHVGEAAHGASTTTSSRRSCIFCCIGVYSISNARDGRAARRALRLHRLRLHQARDASPRRCCWASCWGR